MKLIASGPVRLDIDAYACIVAYTDFLIKQKKEHVSALIPYSYSPSCTQEILHRPIEPSLSEHFMSGYEGDELLVLFDVSGTEFLSQHYNLDNVIELRDHRYGYQDFWNDKLGNMAHIEMVGSCTTLIYEHIKEHGSIELLSETSQKLLYIATLANTLNLTSSVTTNRDRTMINEMQIYIQASETVAQDYFVSVQQELAQDIYLGLTNETKHETIGGHKTMIVQCEVRDAEQLIHANSDAIYTYMHSGETDRRVLTCPSTKHGYNVLICADQSLQADLSALITITRDGDIGKTEKLFLRKEILHRAKIG